MTVENGVTLTTEKLVYNPPPASPESPLPDGLLYRDLQPGCYFGASSRSSKWHLICFPCEIGPAGWASSSKARSQGKSKAEKLNELSRKRVWSNGFASEEVESAFAFEDERRFQQLRLAEAL